MTTYYKGAFQSTVLGSAIRFITGRRYIKYEDEVNFPKKYTLETISRTLTQQQSRRADLERQKSSSSQTLRNGSTQASSLPNATQSEKTVQRNADGASPTETRSTPSGDTVVEQPTGTNTEGKATGEKAPKRSDPQDPEQGEDPNLVTWYGPNDPENP